MGLSMSIDNKVIKRRGNGFLTVAEAGMQGFRDSMEDSSCMELSLPSRPSTSILGVFDGHAGKCTSQFLSEELAQGLDKLPELSPDVVTAFVHSLDDRLRARPPPDTCTSGSTAAFAIVHRTTVAIDDAPCKAVEEEDIGKDTEYQMLSNELLQKFQQGGRVSLSELPPHPRFRHLPTDLPNGAETPAFLIMAANVGDSRLVLVRRDGQFHPLSRDHHPTEVSGEANRIRAAGGHVRMGRVSGILAVSRAVGDFDFKSSADQPADNQIVVSTPEYACAVAYPGDYLLIFCDGLVEALCNSTIVSTVHTLLTNPSAPLPPIVLPSRPVSTGTRVPAYMLQQDVTKDLGYILCKLLDKCKVKSKDNMTVQMALFGDGSLPPPDKGEEIIPGPYDENDKLFMESYRKNLNELNLTLEEAISLRMAATVPHEEVLRQVGADNTIKPEPADDNISKIISAYMLHEMENRSTEGNKRKNPPE
mmetsp:Transcript_52282/g.131268  ORF Transcript_52282/g.131268 Transcript_52282/m.131268 type:complete len:476 (-) Transcript_52282:229-1656(-)|eukprot:CAMPEP_0177678128 /NCGR_PEP_ID=MMETSP0447-20121125/28833_1 /TAXON_ID=0 /ORGANISM="Stygamoeba regulata, Strain BSH-02190019" /LENGTH=475 /DNA_ID=CAMNT_0019187089 /DNA_START=15 /DNA_END=1442 /DNA_ORIENTATION=+